MAQGSCASICSTPPPSPYSNTITCRGPKTKKIMYNLDENDDFDRELIATYEEGNSQHILFHYSSEFH